MRRLTAECTADGGMLDAASAPSSGSGCTAAGRPGRPARRRPGRDGRGRNGPTGDHHGPRRNRVRRSRLRQPRRPRAPLPASAAAIRAANEAGFQTVVVTNQAGVARGYFEESLRRGGSRARPPAARRARSASGRHLLLPASPRSRKPRLPEDVLVPQAFAGNARASARRDGHRSARVVHDRRQRQGHRSRASGRGDQGPGPHRLRQGRARASVPRLVRSARSRRGRSRRRRSTGS